MSDKHIKWPGKKLIKNFQDRRTLKLYRRKLKSEVHGKAFGW